MAASVRDAREIYDETARGCREQASGASGQEAREESQLEEGCADASGRVRCLAGARLLTRPCPPGPPLIRHSDLPADGARVARRCAHRAEATCRPQSND